VVTLNELVHLVAALGGITTTERLLRAGASADVIHRAVVVRRVVLRPRRGVIALLTTPRPILRAAQAGGALASVSAAAQYGIWTPHEPRLHISVPRNAGRPRHAVVLHRDAHHLGRDEQFLVSRERCVLQCIARLEFAEAVALLDSALHQDAEGATPPLDLARMRRQLAKRLHPILDAADGRAEAGAESIARVRLARIGIVARPQCWVARGIRVDLLIDDRLVIEIGSQEFHAEPDQYEADHVRAAVVVGLGFELLEFTTLQVMNDWETVERVILERAMPLATLRGQVGPTRRRMDAEAGVSGRIAP